MNHNVKNHRILSIVAIFSSLIFGLVALNYSWQVDKALKDGDIETAKKHSKTAATWAWIGLGIGITYIVLSFAARQ